MAWIRSNEWVSDNLIPDIDHEVNGSGRLVAIDGDDALARGGVGGGSPELRILTAPKLSFQQGFLLWHRDDVANSFCSPWATKVSPLLA
jgi:hypothetical protein